MTGRTESPAGIRAAVYVLDDDIVIQGALTALFSAAGLAVFSFASADAFLAASQVAGVPACLIVEARLPGMSGLDFHDQYRKDETALPVVYIAGRSDVPMAVRAMKAGAVDFLPKPFRDRDIMDAVATALDRDRQRREAMLGARECRARYGQLTAREAEIMAFVAAGLLNKQIAAEIGLAEITVKVHRSSMMRKMGAGSVAELVRLYHLLHPEGLVPALP